MEGRCERHSFEAAEASCRMCGGEYCADCLVYPKAGKKAPFCMSCAVRASGVRSSAGGKPLGPAPKLSRKERKEQEKQALAAASNRAPTVTAADDGEKKGRLKRKAKETAPVAESRPTGEMRPAYEPSSSVMDIQPALAAEEPDRIPAGLGMPAVGAEDIDWSKPFSTD